MAFLLGVMNVLNPNGWPFVFLAVWQRPRGYCRTVQPRKSKPTFPS